MSFDEWCLMQAIGIAGYIATCIVAQLFMPVTYVGMVGLIGYAAGALGFVRYLGWYHG